MKLLSTRGGPAVTAPEAIVRGICPTGGLYVPSEFPTIDPEQLPSDYCGMAYEVLHAYLDEFDSRTLKTIIRDSYASFDTSEVTPLVGFNDQESILELWHGPTMAFKDVALQMLPRLLTESLRLTGDHRTAYILVATSGDTGKAALAGFSDVPGTRALVFYPHGGVSEAQRLQMVTQEGNNVDVCAVRGNFDDAQTGVKKIFTNDELRERLNTEGYLLSSANSINFGRLLPQIVYYFYAYKSLRDAGKIAAGEQIAFCVPTGNFGDILAGYYAMRMGLPVSRLVCASNRNDVLTEFFRTGTYNAKRPFYRSMSCSIDILISSNLERLLYEISGRDASTVCGWMKDLSCNGRFSVSSGQKEALSAVFDAGCCTEEETLLTIRSSFENRGYLFDPHTAVAQKVLESLPAFAGHTVVLSTANPYKFSSAVLSAFEEPSADDFVNADRLEEISSMKVPSQFRQLKDKPELHLDVCEIDDMPNRVLLPVIGTH